MKDFLSHGPTAQIHFSFLGQWLRCDKLAEALVRRSKMQSRPGHCIHWRLEAEGWRLEDRGFRQEIKSCLRYAPCALQLFPLEAEGWRLQVAGFRLEVSG